MVFVLCKWMQYFLSNVDEVMYGEYLNTNTKYITCGHIFFQLIFSTELDYIHYTERIHHGFWTTPDPDFVLLEPSTVSYVMKQWR